MKDRLDWQHVAIFAIGAGCMLAVILAGKGNMVIQICAALGGTSGIAALLKWSPLYGPPAKKDGES
jgi:hypothetical protein